MKNKFNKILSVFMSLIFFFSAFNLPAFAQLAPTAPRAPGKTELNEQNVRIVLFEANVNAKYVSPKLVLDTYDDEGTLVNSKTLTEDIDYTLQYLLFRTDSIVNMRIKGIGNYTGDFELSGQMVQPVGQDFTVSTDKDVHENQGLIAARTYTYLDKVPLNVTLPLAEGEITLYYNGMPIEGPIAVTDKFFTISYDTTKNGIAAGPNSKNTAITVEWSRTEGTVTKKTHFVVAGFNLNKFDLSKAEFEPIPKRDVIAGMPYEPEIFLKDRKGVGESLTSNANCSVKYENNINESSATYPARAIVMGQNNFTGQAILPFELVVSEIPSGIAVDRADKLYTYGDEIVMTAYVRSGVSTNNIASFWVVRDDVAKPDSGSQDDAMILLGTAKVDYIGNNGTATLKYQTSGKELKVFKEGIESEKNKIVVTFVSGTAAEVEGIMMRPKPVTVNVHCKDKVYDMTNTAVIPTGPGVINYTFNGRLLRDDIYITDLDKGEAIFGTSFDLPQAEDYYAGAAKPTIARNFKVSGIHEQYYLYPQYAYGTAKISKKYDPSLIVTTPPENRFTYVISSDEGKFILENENAIELKNNDGDRHFGELTFKVSTVMDIDRGGIFAKKPMAEGNVISYTVKDIEIEEPPQKASATLVVSSTNYTDINTSLDFELIKKKWARIEGFSIDSKTYDGKPAVLNGKAKITSEDGGLLLSTKDLVIVFQSADGGSYNAATPPTLPGKYYAVITLPKTAYGYSGKTVLPFTIEKANVTITTPSFEIYQGQENLPEILISYSGFVNNETVEVFQTNTLVAKHSAVDAVVPGRFPINFTGEISSDKYNFNFVGGMLTIIKVTKYPAVGTLPEDVNGITVYTPKNSLPTGITSFEELALSFNAVEANDLRLIQNVLSQKSGYRNNMMMDIKLIEILTGKSVQPKAKVTISVPYPKGTDSTYTFKVLHLYKNSSKIEVIAPKKVVGGIQFQVSEFSAFVIGWAPPAAQEDLDFLIKNAQITTEKKQFSVAVKEEARKSSYALTKFFEASNKDKSVVFNNPDVIITFEKEAIVLKDAQPSYDFYAQKDGCEHELAARAAGGDAVVCVVHFHHEGLWPGVANVSVNVGDGYNGEELAYYYYNPNTQKLEYQSKAKVSKDGWFTVSQDHCSDYVISTEFPKVTPTPTPTPTPAPPVEPEEEVGFFAKIGGAIWEFIKSIPAFIMGIPGFIKEFPTNFKNFTSNVKNFFTNVKNKAIDIFDNVKSFFSKVSAPFVKVFNKVKDVVGDFVDGVKEKIGDIFGGIKTKVGGVFAGVKETASDAVDVVKDNIFLFVFAIILLIIIVVIAFFVIKFIKKKKAAKEESEQETEAENAESDSSDETDESETPPQIESNEETKTDDDIEY